MGSKKAPRAVPPDKPPTVPSVSIKIEAPTEGASFEGPHTGVDIEVKGKVTFVGGGSGSANKRVFVRVGSGRFLSARVDGGTFQTTRTVTDRGPVGITASAFMIADDQSEVSASDSRTVNVTLAEPPDTTNPTATISFPANGQVLLAPAEGKVFTVKGTASDPGSPSSGVGKVEIFDGDGWMTADKVRPDWSEWSKEVELKPGPVSIKARSADNKGNVSTETSVEVDVQAEPLDTTDPTVGITKTTPPGPDVEGPTTGLLVEVEGTASDPGSPSSGIKEVQLLVDGFDQGARGNPVTPGDWSRWKGQVKITEPGKHFISARCEDNASNETTDDESALELDVRLVPEFSTRFDRLIIVESYRLSNFVGAHGRGRTVKTFSLLPGEKTQISVKTFTKTETDAKRASTILDSLTETSAANFETAMGREQTNKAEYEQSRKYNVEVEAGASWGFGSASIKAGVSGSSNAAREEFAKNISNATQKHVAEASAKRDVQVDTSYEVKVAAGEETAITREIENVNVSRSLNFVFSQMNQEFITILHLVDVRVGYFHAWEVVDPDTGQKEEKYTWREVALPQLDALLGDAIKEDKRAEVRAGLLRQLGNIFDYEGVHHSFYEETAFRDPDGNTIPDAAYLRVKKGYTSTYRDYTTGTEIRVPGIIMAANKHVLRTEGLMCDALLGQGNGLDAYSRGLQDEAVKAKTVANEQMQTEIERQRLAREIIEDRDEVAAALFKKIYPGQPVQAIPYVLTPFEENENGQPT